MHSESDSQFTTTTDNDGVACLLLPPDSYSASIKLSSDADEAGMR